MVVNNKPTGYTDIEDSPILEGDLINICFTSGGAEHVHDVICEVEINRLYGLVFSVKCLAWASFGQNQYTINSEIKSSNILGEIYDKERLYLYASDNDRSGEMRELYPFNNEKMLSFSSRYFKKTDNPEEIRKFISEGNFYDKDYDLVEFI